MRKLAVCHTSELPPGARRIVEVNDRLSIGVFNVDGRYYALRNICPHRKAPLCRGPLTGRVASDRPGHARMDGPTHIIRCPWHGWEFDITTGQSVFNPHKVRVRTYPVAVEDACDCNSDDAKVDTYPVNVEQNVITVLLDGSG